MKSGDLASRFDASMILPQREAGTLPLRRSSPLIEAWEATKRWASSDSDISSENSATAFFAPSAAFSAKLAISALLPIDGRAARMIRLPGWKPPVIPSRSSKPDGVPVIALPSCDSRSSLSISAKRTSWIARKSLRESSCATSRIVRSAMSTSSRGGASCEWTRAWISYDARRSRRSIAFSRTIRAYWRRWPTAGTLAASRSIVARPPAASSCPACLRCSTSVSASTGSPPLCSSSMAAKTTPCDSR